MHAGEVRESGSHAELLALRGLYYRLYQLQYAAESPAHPPIEVHEDRLAEPSDLGV